MHPLSDSQDTIDHLQIITEKEGNMWKKGGGTSMFGRTDWNERFFVLAGGTLTYFQSEADYRASKVPTVS